MIANQRYQCLRYALSANLSISVSDAVKSSDTMSDGQQNPVTDVRTRSRVVRNTRPYSPDVRLPTRTRKRKPCRTQLAVCKNCEAPLRGTRKLLCAQCLLEPALLAGCKEKNEQLQEEEKQKYLEEARAFAANLAKVFEDTNAERLYCPNFRYPRGPCACLQKYLLGNGEDQDQRVHELLLLLGEAKDLCKQKCYNLEEVKRINGVLTVGLGNGQKHSESYELFVAKHRPKLRERKLCERATQRVLLYSNNFLHKFLKTEPNVRDSCFLSQLFSVNLSL